MERNERISDRMEPSNGAGIVLKLVTLANQPKVGGIMMKDGDWSNG